jgi:hypothetical protein
MKREMELVYKILEFTESKDDFIDPVLPEIKGFDGTTICYHVKILAQANLIEAKDWSTDDGPTWVLTHMTNKGHDFFENLKQESIWGAIKSEFKDASLDTIISVSKQLAEGWAKKKVTVLLAENS